VYTGTGVVQEYKNGTGVLQWCRSSTWYTGAGIV